MKKKIFQKIKKELPEIKINVPLKEHTTFKIGGPAKYFLVAKNKEDLIKAILVAKKFRLPFFILGGGSNILVADKGFKGLIIKFQNPNSKIQIKSKIQNPKIYVEAGASLASVVTEATKNSLTGLEWAVGIPGTVGGAIYGNAGAFGSSMANVVKTVEVMEILKSKIQKSKVKMKNGRAKFKIKEYKNKECQFGYRDSIFKHKKNLIILSATFQLKKVEKSAIEKKIKKNLKFRKERQPLNFPSAGSVFKNPKSKIQNSKLLEKFPEMKGFKKNGFIPAGWLIEKCGLKGKRIGGAKISEKNANFIVNLGKGKAKDVIKLINLIKKKVKKEFKINLEEEIQYLGF